MLEMHNVSKTYGDTIAVHPLDLQFSPGKITALMGPSGCGKSTVLRMLVGLIEPTTGHVLLDGEPLTPDNVRQARLKMGYVIQEGGLFPHLTCRDNVTIMARHLGWPRNKISDRLAELESMMQLPEGALDRYPVQISGGQRQRVSLMRALFLDPEVVLLDEPMGALDPMIRSELQAQLRQIFVSLKKTVVMVTHDIGEAGFLADVNLLLKEGRVLQRGSLADLANRPADPFVSEFLNAQRSPLESLEDSTA